MKGLYKEDNTIYKNEERAHTLIKLNKLCTSPLRRDYWSSKRCTSIDFCSFNVPNGS